MQSYYLGRRESPHSTLAPAPRSLPPSFSSLLIGKLTLLTGSGVATDVGHEFPSHVGYFLVERLRKRGQLL